MGNVPAEIRICVIIPTCNRNTAIDYWLSSNGRDFGYFGIDLIIYDSSSDDSTEIVVKEHIQNGMPHVFYKRYNGVFDGVSLDHKVLSAYREYAPFYDYVWACRDGTVIDIIEIYHDLLPLLKKGYDIITVDDSLNDSKNIGNRIYTDCREFYHDHLVHGITLGYMVFSGKTICSIIKEIPLDTEKNYTLYQPIAIFHYIADHAFTAASYFGNVYHFNPNEPGDSFWKKNNMALWQWTKHWYSMVSLLPDIYDKSDLETIRLNMAFFNPFSYKALLVLKRNHSLRICDIKKYKRYIPYVTDVPLSRFYLVTIIPSCLINIIFDNCFIYRSLRGLYRSLKRRNPQRYSNI